MTNNALLSESIALVGIIDPGANAAGTLTTAWIDMSVWQQLIAIIMAGTLGAGGTLDAKFQQATDSAGTGAKDIPGKAITQMTQAGTNMSSKQRQINLHAQELDRTNGFKFVRLSLTTAVATGASGAVVLGLNARYSPVTPVASVTETIE